MFSVSRSFTRKSSWKYAPQPCDCGVCSGTRRADVWPSSAPSRNVAHWLPVFTTSGLSELLAVSVELNTRLIGSKRAALP